MKGIDLTKCNNCLFRAVFNGRPVSGTVKVGEEWCNLIFDGGIVSIRVSGLLEDSGIADFEIVPRDPETYRDWQVGDIIVNRDGCTGRIIFRSGDFVAADIDGCMCYTCEEMLGSGWRLVLTDIERRIIEEKKYKPQDGDIVAWQSKENSAGWAISIYEEKDGSYMTLFTSGSCRATDSTLDMQVIRPATDEEKQRLFDAMSKKGKRWNAEKKIVEDIPKPYEFKKGEPVLVKDEGGKWHIGVFIQKENSFYGYRTRPSDGIGEIGYRYCLPYNERTMHLLGTSEDYKEEQL